MRDESGIVDYAGNIVANPRKTFVTPPGTGFLPRETAEHHAEKIIPLIKEALHEAKLSRKDIGRAILN
jgi:N6-L-threonylcarbamoyladenine synthase